jgi:lipoprotein-anchoring transpeptidase ErfK/SrfK
MRRFKLLNGVAFVAVAAMLISVAPPKAAAQGFFESLFGGGGFGRSGRQMVAFTRQHKPGTIVVSFGDRRLYYVTSPGEAISYPIGVPTGRAAWSGTSHVSMKRVNPDWTPTPDMRRENPELPAFVPGGHPRNPLGVRALYLGDTLYRIHGTDAPWTIGQEVSRGCIRLYNDDVIDLYNRVRIGAPVIVTWNRYNS